jgi:hypothetical protein
MGRSGRGRVHEGASAFAQGRVWMKQREQASHGVRSSTSEQLAAKGGEGASSNWQPKAGERGMDVWDGRSRGRCVRAYAAVARPQLARVERTAASDVLHLPQPRPVDRAHIVVDDVAVCGRSKRPHTRGHFGDGRECVAATRVGVHGALESGSSSLSTGRPCGPRSVTPFHTSGVCR